MCVSVRPTVCARPVKLTCAVQVILPNHGLLEAHAQVDAILAMLPDEELRASMSERFKVSYVSTFEPGHIID